MADLEIEEHVLVCGARLIMHVPAPSHELQLSLAQKCLNDFSHPRLLPLEPIREIFDLIVRKGPSMVRLKTSYHLLENPVKVPL